MCSVVPTITAIGTQLVSPCARKCLGILQLESTHNRHDITHKLCSIQFYTIHSIHLYIDIYIKYFVILVETEILLFATVEIIKVNRHLRSRTLTMGHLRPVHKLIKLIRFPIVPRTIQLSLRKSAANGIGVIPMMHPIVTPITRPIFAAIRVLGRFSCPRVSLGVSKPIFWTNIST